MRIVDTDLPRVDVLLHQEDDSKRKRSTDGDKAQQDQPPWRMLRVVVALAEADTFALHGQELANARAEFELEQVSQAEQSESAMERLLDRARGEMSQLKSAYAKKLGEQAALVANERRRLQNQVVTLDEALAQSRPAAEPLVLGR